MKDRIFRRKNFGVHWGRFALAGSQIAVLVSTYTMLMVTINAYAPISEWLIQHGVYIRFWMFMAIVVLPLPIAYVLAWKYLVPLFYRSSVDQFMAQNTELTDKLAKLDSIEKILADELPIISKRLEALEKK